MSLSKTVETYSSDDDVVASARREASDDESESTTQKSSDALLNGHLPQAPKIQTRATYRPARGQRNRPANQSTYRYTSSTSSESERSTKNTSANTATRGRIRSRQQPQQKPSRPKYQPKQQPTSGESTSTTNASTTSDTVQATKADVEPQSPPVAPSPKEDVSNRDDKPNPTQSETQQPTQQQQPRHVTPAQPSKTFLQNQARARQRHQTTRQVSQRRPPNEQKSKASQANGHPSSHDGTRNTNANQQGRAYQQETKNRQQQSINHRRQQHNTNTSRTQSNQQRRNEQKGLASPSNQDPRPLHPHNRQERSNRPVARVAAQQDQNTRNSAVTSDTRDKMPKDSNISNSSDESAKAADAQTIASQQAIDPVPDKVGEEDEVPKPATPDTSSGARPTPYNSLHQQHRQSEAQSNNKRRYSSQRQEIHATNGPVPVSFIHPQPFGVAPVYGPNSRGVGPQYVPYFIAAPQFVPIGNFPYIVGTRGYAPPQFYADQGYYEQPDATNPPPSSESSGTFNVAAPAFHPGYSYYPQHAFFPAEWYPASPAQSEDSTTANDQ